MPHKPYELRTSGGLLISRHASLRYAKKAQKAFHAANGYAPQMHYIGWDLSCR